MNVVPATLTLVIGVAIVYAAARRVGILPPLLLVLAGVVASLVPGVPDYALDPHLMLVVVLPPLLYAAAIDTSLPAFRRNLRPIFLLAVGLVIFTALGVGFILHAVVGPSLPLAVALAFGAIVAPPDAVAATAVARRTGLPRRVVSVLEGESLVNDATALTLLSVATGAIDHGHVTGSDLGTPRVFAGAVTQFLLTAVGGVVIGLVVAKIIMMLRTRTADIVLDTTISLLTPFTAYALAEAAHVSGVLAVVVGGLWLGHRAPVVQSAGSRLAARAIWQTVEFLLQGVVFALVGLQLRSVVSQLDENTPVVAASVAVMLAVVLLRPLWVFPVTYLSRMLPGPSDRDPFPPWQLPAVISWSGMRGVVSLAAALSLPDTPVVHKPLLVFLTFVVIVVTLVGQGATLPWLIRRLGLRPPDASQDFLAEAGVQQEAARAASTVLDRLVAEGPAPEGVEQRLRRDVEDRAHAAWERLGGGGVDEDTGETLLVHGPSEGPHIGRPGLRETPSAAYRRLRRAMLTAERETFVAARDEGRVAEEVLRRVLRDLDLEETMLYRE